MAAYTHYRLLITATDIGNGSNTTNAAEIIFYDSGGSVISLSGGTASASSSQSSFTADKAFDGNPSTFWASFGTPTSGGPEWIQYEFPSPVDVDHFTITNSTFGYGPSVFKLQGGTGGSWADIYGYSGAVFNPGAPTTVTFYTTGVVFGISVTSVTSGIRVTVSNFVLKDAGGAPLSTATGTALATSWDLGLTGGNTRPESAFAGSCPTKWTSAYAASLGTPQTIAFHFPSAVTVGSFSFQSAIVANAPVAFSLVKSTDGINYTAIQTYSSLPWSTTCQSQAFTVVLGTPSISASPDIGTQCETQTITITGTNTHFVNGTTTVSISGTGAIVSGISVASANSLTFSLAVSCSAALGVRVITVTTGSESVTTPFYLASAAIIAALIQGNIAWAQLRLGYNGRFGIGMYGASTDGSGSAGVIPVWGGPDGKTLTAGGGGSLTSGFLTTYIAGTPVLDANGDPIIDSSGEWIF